jgi:hypothetical protein
MSSTFEELKALAQKQKEEINKYRAYTIFVITPHAYDRGKERFGFDKKVVEKKAKKAIKEGKAIPTKEGSEVKFILDKAAFVFAVSSEEQKTFILTTILKDGDRYEHAKTRSGKYAGKFVKKSVFGLEA